MSDALAVIVSPEYVEIDHNRRRSAVAEATTELIYEVLKRMQADLSVLREDMGEVKSRLTSVERSLAAMYAD